MSKKPYEGTGQWKDATEIDVTEWKDAEQAIEQESGDDSPADDTEENEAATAAANAASGNSKKGKRKATDDDAPAGTQDKKVRVSTNAGLPWDVQKALAQEIEADGGMAWFKMKKRAVKSLCDRNPGLFGQPGSKRREKVRNKIKYWRTYSPSEYKELLESFMSRGPARRNATELIQQQSTIPGPRYDGPHVGDPTPQAMMAKMPAELFNVRTLKAEAQARQKRAKARSLPIREDQQYETIQVDTKRPENNRGIGVFEFADAEKEGFLHNGYEITMEGDIRDFMADHYKAQLIDNKDILLRIPAVSYSFLHDHEEYEKRAKSANIECPSSEEAREGARKRILRDPSRQERLVLLEFPGKLELTNKVFSPESTDGEIDFDLLPITINVNLNGKDLPMTITRISWKVSVVEKQTRSVQKDEPENPAQTKGAAKLANLF